jgi:MFS family permease
VFGGLFSTTGARFDPRVWRMAIARAINTMGLSLVMSFLGIYVVETRGYPAWLYGLIAAVANLGQSAVSGWAGALSDRIGRRPLISIGLFVRATVIAALGTQVYLDAPLWSLALNMVVSSSLRGCFEPVAYALVADVVTPEQRIAAFGLHRMSANLGWAIGPALGGILTLFLPYGTVFYLAAAGMVIAGFITLTIADPVTRGAVKDDGGDLLGALRDGWRDPVLRLLLVGTLCCALLETQMFSTFGIYVTKEIGLLKSDVGVLYAINGAVVLVLQLPAIALLNRWGHARSLPWSSAIDAVGFAVVGFASGFGGAAAAIVCLTVAEVLFDPAHQAAIAECADPERRGRTFGVVAFVQMVGVAFAPLVGGILLDTIGDHHVGMWLAISLFGVGQTWCFIAYVRRRRAVLPLAR